MANAKFITFEGGEGAGKSTQADLLANRLREQGIPVLVTREPGGSPYAELIRRTVLSSAGATTSALGEFLLFSAARADHLETVIRPALASGIWVLCDRFIDSSRVYQGCLGGVARNIISDIEGYVVGRNIPDLTILLDQSADIGLERAKLRGETNRIDDKGLDFHMRLRTAFLKIAAEEPERFRVIDANDTVETVASKVWGAVAERLLTEG